MSATQQIVEYIRKRGVARSDELDAEFMLMKAGGSEVLLRDLVFNGELVSCLVMKPGQRDVVEYRPSALAGGRLTIGAPGTSNEGRKRAKGLAAMHAAKRADQPKAAARGERTPPPPRAPSPAPAAPVQEKPMTTNVTPHIGAIETTVPVPPQIGELRKAIREMKPGESRLVVGYSRHTIGNTASREKVAHVLRKEGAGFRIWRVEA